MMRHGSVCRIQIPHIPHAYRHDPHMTGSRFRGSRGAENAPQRPSARRSLVAAVVLLVSYLAHGRATAFLRLDSNPTAPLTPPPHVAGTGIDARPRSSRSSTICRDLVHAALGLLAATGPRIRGLRGARVEPGGDFGHPRCARAGMRAVVCAAWLRAACARSARVAIALMREIAPKSCCEYRLCVV